MSRAWPFEGVEEKKSFKYPRDFFEARPGVVGVIVRIGLHDAQLVLVDGNGRWQQWVYHSMEEAKSAAEELGIETHEGEYPEELRVKINGYARPQEDFDKAAYPEQGGVGPVMPYPENRPRDVAALKREMSEQKETAEQS